MRSFVIRELRIVSLREKSARLISFHREVTVITGENDTGKSSVLKTIYWTLGAEPAKISDEWRSLDICAALTIEYDEKVLTVVRHDRNFGVFDQLGKLIAAFASATKGMGPYLAQLFHFGLVLNNRATGLEEIPPPAFYLLPYYMDQDSSWAKIWSSFASLGQYADWQNDVAEYHTGFRNNAYYRLKARIRMLAVDRQEPEREERALSKALEQIKGRFPFPSVDIDSSRFELELRQLVSDAEKLAGLEQAYRQKIGEITNQRSFLKSQLELAKSVLGNLEKDYRFALRQHDEIDCPTCGATYNNSIIERFSLAIDQQRCEDLVVSISNELLAEHNKLADTERQLVDVQDASAKIQDLLAVEHGRISLRTIIQSEARGEAIGVIDEQLNSTRSKLEELASEASVTQYQMSELDAKGRRKEYLENLTKLVGRFSFVLNVPAPVKFSKFAPPIHETGSDVPRAVLAYQFAILSLAWQNSLTIHAPLCIDSPNQQDQDVDNYRGMLAFIRDNTPKDVQLIVGFVDSQGIEFAGEKIELLDRRRLLNPEFFSSIGRDVVALIARTYDATTESEGTHQASLLEDE